MTASKTFGAPGHPGVPLIFAWGIHTGLSYQRPGWKQASLEEIKREGVDRFVKWGANLVELYPYYLAVAANGHRLLHVDGGEAVRTVPDFEAVETAKTTGPDGVATLIPREFNHPPLKGYATAKGHVVAYSPGADIVMTFQAKC